MIPLIKNGGGNHDPETWAHATVRTIFNGPPDQLADLHDRATHALTPYYRSVILCCHTPHHVDDVVDYALDEMLMALKESEWSRYATDEWKTEARATIGNHLATAAQIERQLVNTEL